MKYITVALLLTFFAGCSAKQTLQPKAPQTVQKIVECEPKIVYQDRIVVEEKPVIQEKIVYKDKIIYKDRVIYKNSQISQTMNTQSDKPIIGRIEYVTIVSADEKGKAKIDTGAKTTSVDARDIVRFERDGKEWVKFNLLGKSIERPLINDILIKRHGTKPQKRAVVKLRLRLGDVSRNVQVTLADRDQYIYPILVGRNFLKDTFVVDVSQIFMVKSSKKKGKKK